MVDSAAMVGVAYRSKRMPASQPAATPEHLKSRFLGGLAPRDLKVVLAAARQRQFFANSVVANQGHPADYLFLLTRGRARFFFNTREGKKVVLLWLTPGEIFGGSALLNLAAHYPRLLENALLIASDYLAWYLADHVALISQRAPQRLARVLVCLAETIGDKTSEGFEFDATNEELASAANVTAFTASRLLSEWQSNRAIVKRRGKILLRSPERLLVHTA